MSDAEMPVMPCTPNGFASFTFFTCSTMQRFTG
jgi:hypothetical protein